MTNSPQSCSAESRDALQHYATEYCEGWCKDAPSNANFDDCGGCRARLALRRITGVAQAAPQSATLTSSIEFLIKCAFLNGKTMSLDYTKCRCCEGTDENREDSKPSIEAVEHEHDCPIARDLPLIRAIAAQPPAAPVNPPAHVDHWSTTAEAQGLHPPAAPVETDDITEALNARQEAINESMARPRSSAATEREDNTCYVNRSEVRCILLAQSTRDVPATEKMLRAIDALQIFVAADFRTEPQSVPQSYRDTVRRVGQAREKRLRELRDALEEIASIGRKITDPKNTYGLQMGNIADAALSLTRPHGGGE